MPTTRRLLLAGSGAALGLGSMPFTLRAANSTWAPYSRAIVIDGLGGPGSQASDLGAPISASEADDIRRSGMTCLHLTVGAVGSMPADEAYDIAVKAIARYEGEVDRNSTALLRVRSVADILAAKARGLTGLMYGFQDGVSFESDLERLTTFHRLGVRVIQPTYNRHNRLGDGCMEPLDGGLSTLGREAVERMNALGILVDLSHCGRATAAEAMHVSKRPVAFTHTGCFALAEHPRNRTDDELRAVAAKGGVAGIYVMPYLSGGHQPRAEDVIRHIEHAINVAGEEHVSIGTDGSLSAVDLTPEYRANHAAEVAQRKAAGIGATQEFADGYPFASDLNTPRRFERIAELLHQRGHSDARIEKVLGANLLRVFGETWQG